MTLASDLANILKPDKLVPVAPGGGIVLRDPQSRMKVHVVDAPATVAAVRLERIGHSSGLRDGPWKRVCDYLLVVESGERTDAIFIELKKTLTEEIPPRDQLRRSAPILEYLRAVCEVESDDGAARSISKRFFIVAERGGRRLDKQWVKTEPAGRVQSVQFGNLTIRTFIGTRVSLATLLGT